MPLKIKEKNLLTVPPQKKYDRCLGNNHAREACPAKDAICHACKKRGHYKKDCRSKHIREVTAYTDQVREATDQMEELFLGFLKNRKKEKKAKVKIKNRKPKPRNSLGE